MKAIILLAFGIIPVLFNLLGVGLLSAYIARRTRQVWLAAGVIVVTLGELYCLLFLFTPLDRILRIEFLERLPYEVGMSLGFGLLWIQWIAQITLYWRRRRHSPMMYFVSNAVIVSQIVNLVGIGILFCFCPTMMIVQGGWSQAPANYRHEWLFEIGWLTYFSLAFLTPVLLLSLKSAPRFWRLRHWAAGSGVLTTLGWWVYWINCADVVRSIALR
ncbi:MAG: hypothetical protein AAGB01_06440 [Cyanobacteria bacterium P01_F01_bin.42]